MSITHLVELQDIDSQLDDLNGLLGDLPKMVEELNEQESRLLSNIEEDKTRLKEIDLSLKKSETANSGIQDKINKLTDQLFLVTNNKQYDALTNEIDHLKKQKDENDSHIISFMDENEMLEKSISELDNDKVLLVLGKGAENYQIIKDKKIYHSDLEIIKKLI